MRRRMLILSISGAVLVGAILVVAAGCQQGTSEAPWKNSAMGRDLERICNVMKYSGADKESEENHAYLTATWLSSNIESNEARDFMISLGQLAESAKPALLQEKAKAAGLNDCPTVALWQKAN